MAHSTVDRNAGSFVAAYLFHLLFERLEEMSTATGKFQKERIREACLECARDLFSQVSVANDEQAAELDIFASPHDQRVEILSLLYGLDGGFPYSRQVVASRMGLSVEDIVRVESLWLSGLASHVDEFFTGARRAWLKKNACSECGAAYGEPHAFECIAEECPFCHGRVWSCECSCEKLGLGDRPLDFAHDDREHENGRRRLNMEEKRRWFSSVIQHGAVLYGEEQQFQG